MRWMQCHGCDQVFTDGYFAPAAMALLFGRTHDHQRPGSAMEPGRLVAARMVEKVAALAGETGAWLDVGCGSGALLFAAQEWGFDPVGLDLRPSTAQAMQRFGVETHAVDLADFVAPCAFAVVSMADVLEHMPFPQHALAAARRLLRPGGTLLASMPNADCALWRQLDAEGKNPCWGELEHFHKFTRTRLYSLLAETGFQPLRYGSPSATGCAWRCWRELPARGW
jgi:2-polyprenyl-3-methyl-5-hydroxy-6-metoxy-1,4-benzoquinol methylase